MADDERLLELLEQALAPEPRQPPAEGVAAVRHLAGRSRTTAPPVRLPEAPRHAWPHRAGWLAAGVSVAAAAVVIALLALPTLVGSGRHDSDASSGGQATPQTVARLRVALSTNDPVAVARADANLLRHASALTAPEQDDAVAVHVEAIQFLRDHPSADAAAQLPTSPSVAPVHDRPPVTTTIAPKADPSDSVPAVTPTVPTTVVAGPPGVAITAVVARLDGTFQVEFNVFGFAPDASGAPGSHYVRFTFDEGKSPTAWDGPSPWSFPVAAGLVYHRVCAHVADAAGVEDPSTGVCQNIV